MYEPQPTRSLTEHGAGLRWMLHVGAGCGACWELEIRGEEGKWDGGGVYGTPSKEEKAVSVSSSTRRQAFKKQKGVFEYCSLIQS